VQITHRQLVSTKNSSATKSSICSSTAPLLLKLEELVKLKVIERVTEPSDWVSSMVVIKKTDNTIRICLDPTDLNKVIKRPIYPLPTIEQVLPKLKNAKYFSLLDAKNGYW